MLKLSQNKRDTMIIYYGQLKFFFLFCIICIILSARLRKNKRKKNNDRTLKKIHKEH
jgi:hypothetical protein